MKAFTAACLTLAIASGGGWREKQDVAGYFNSNTIVARNLSVGNGEMQDKLDVNGGAYFAYRGLSEVNNYDFAIESKSWACAQPQIGIPGSNARQEAGRRRG